MTEVLVATGVAIADAVIAAPGVVGSLSSLGDDEPAGYPPEGMTTATVAERLGAGRG